MFRPRFLLAALLCGTLFVSHATADNAWFSLNLEFNDPTDFGSGGTWTVVAKADERGLSAAILELLDVNFVAVTGFLTPAGFEVEESKFIGTQLETVQGDGLGDPTYDVGVIGGTYPSSYVDDPNLIVFGANPDLGSFTGGIELVTGSFDAGDIPTWWTGVNYTDARVFTGAGFQTVDADVALTVRYVAAVPEPTSVLLLGGGMLALAAMRRR